MFSHGEWDSVAKLRILEFLAADPVEIKIDSNLFGFFFPPITSIPFSFDMLFLSFLNK